MGLLHSVSVLIDTEKSLCVCTVVDFFNRINIIYGVVSEFCTEETCPTMSGGAK